MATPAGESHPTATACLPIEARNIDRSRTQARHPSSTPPPSQELYHSLDELQADLNDWLRQYNLTRTHSGKYCYGKTPRQTLLDSNQV